MRGEIKITATPSGNMPDWERAAMEAPRVLDKHLRRGMHAANQQVIARTVRKRFTGKGPFPASENKLGVISGLLRRSIRSSYPQGEMGRINSSMGSHIKYFGAHEFGFEGDVQVKETSVKNYTNDNAFGNNQFSVLAHRRKAHSRHVSIEARAPLGTGIEESQDIYQDQFDADVALTLSELHGG